MTGFPNTFRAVRVSVCRPTWHGEYRLKNEDPWQTVSNQAGNPIAYASEEAAKAGALYMRDKLWVPNMVPEGS